MTKPEDVEYRVVLVFPGFGEERANAEEVVEAALDHLNTQKDEPGFRFAFEVFARLEIVPDLEQAQTKLLTDDRVAMMILHDLDDDERLDFTRACTAEGVKVCWTEPTPDQPKRPRRDPNRRRGFQIVFKARSEDPEAPRAHTISASALSAPIDNEDEEAWIERVQQLICVMALGVMQFHWSRKPPRLPWIE